MAMETPVSTRWPRQPEGCFSPELQTGCGPLSSLERPPGRVGRALLRMADQAFQMDFESQRQQSTSELRCIQGLCFHALRGRWLHRAVPGSLRSRSYLMPVRHQNCFTEMEQVSTNGITYP